MNNIRRNSEAEMLSLEQLHVVYAQTRAAIFGNGSGALLLSAILWNVIDHAVLLTWLGALMAVLAFRYVLGVFFSNRNTADNTTFWCYMYMASSFTTGAIWGVAGICLFPADMPLYHIVISMWILAISTGGLIAYAVNLKVLSAFFIPCMLPVTTHLLYLGDNLHFILGVGLLVYSVGAIYTILPVHKSMVSAIKLNFNLQKELKVRHKMEDKLRTLSYQDGLTGLANRRYFDNIIDKQLRLAKREGAAISLIMLDIDYFKSFNDLYGHVAGDSCLVEVAAIIERAARRPLDLASRYGGEEFAVILPNAMIEDASKIAEEIRNEVQGLNILHENSAVDSCEVITVSAGVCSLTPDRNTKAIEIIELADMALYKAKKSGRNKTVISSVTTS